MNAITSQIIIMTYVENDGMYFYDHSLDVLQKVPNSFAAEYLKKTYADPSFDPDEKFIPSNYLISPYNDIDKFLQDQYFLTTAQNAIKKEIIDQYLLKEYKLYILQAAAGTGKTLLLYDLAKEMMSLKQKVRILHTQQLNDGQKELIQNDHWDICSLFDVDLSAAFQETQMLLVDEAQMLSQPQLEQLLSLSVSKQIPVLLSYDPKQEQYCTPSFDITALIQTNYPTVKLYQNKLTNKIRTNKEMAGFIDNLMKLNSHHNEESYQNISIEYIDSVDTLEHYKTVLLKDQFTVLDLNVLSLKELNGQEYKKAALILDQNCYYEQDELHFYTHKEEVLYEVITRVMDELKIIVLQNPELYQTLLTIKK